MATVQSGFPAGASDPTVEVIGFSFQTNGAGVATVFRGRRVASITDPAAGRFVVQFNTPFPQQIIAAAGNIAETAAAPAANVPTVCCVDSTGYNATTGQLTVRTYVPADTTAGAQAGAEADPTSGRRVDVILVAQMNKTNVQP